MAQINLFDRVLKILGRNYAEAFLRLTFPHQELRLIGTQENVELSLPDHRIDFLHQVKLDNQEYLLHFEFQLQHQRDVPRRVFVYSAELTEQFRKPVISVVLYLERREALLPNEYVVEMGESVIHRFNYPVLKLWDYEAEIRSGQMPEFAPLLVMLASEPSEAVLLREKELILRESNPQKRADSLATAVMIASRYFDRDWLWQFFQEEVEQMRHSTFIEDWIEEGIQQGKQQGLQQGLHQGIQQGKQSLLLQQLKAKFGELPEPVEEEIRAITSEQKLDTLSLRILTANSLDEMGLNGGKSSD
ncbi:MAG: DUF4351 domain-containing protein [Candidatus Poribacteria bacterium]